MPACHLLAERFYHKLKMWRWKKMPNFLCMKVVVTNLFSEYFMEIIFSCIFHHLVQAQRRQHHQVPDQTSHLAQKKNLISVCLWLSLSLTESHWVSVRWEEISIFPPEEDKCEDKRDNLFYLMFIARVLQERRHSIYWQLREKFKHWWSFSKNVLPKAPSRLSLSRNCIFYILFIF